MTQRILASPLPNVIFVTLLDMGNLYTVRAHSDGKLHPGAAAKMDSGGFRTGR